MSHALLPAFVLAWRLDVAETVGAVIAAGGRRRVRGAAGGGAGGGAVYDGARLGAAVPGAGRGSSARGSRRWRWSWAGRRSARPADAGRFALAAIGAAFGAAAGLPGWLALGAWRFASSVSGGRLIAANTTSPYLIVGKRRFMPPVPPLPA